jgi:hypothetical protein
MPAPARPAETADERPTPSDERERALERITP